MSLLEKIKKDMYLAMKAGQKETSRTLRGALAKLKDKQIEKRDDLSETEEIKVLQTMAKQRKESIELFRQGGRMDLVESETAELKVLETYLPQMMSTDEVRSLVESAVAETEATSLSDIGKVMSLVMKKGAGKVNGKLAQQITREVLQQE